MAQRGKEQGTSPPESPEKGSAAVPLDRWGRAPRDLRISVTDRCNFRCTYCMPRDKVDPATFLQRSQILSFEEITQVAREFVAMGTRKIRITGGEPLLRKDLSTLIAMLSPLGAELALTTNGVLLPRYAKQLAEAGLHRVTVSLDALDERIFQQACDAPGFSPKDVLAGIDAAQRAGLSDIKINCVVRRGLNESQILPLVQHFHGSAVSLRFIEYMDVGTRNAWELSEVVTRQQIEALLQKAGDLQQLPARQRGEVAARYSFQTHSQLPAGSTARRTSSELGIISSVSQPFCGDCVRVRLSADGHIYTCLFAQSGSDLRPLLRGAVVAPPASSEQGPPAGALAVHLRRLWEARSERYSQERASHQQNSGRPELAGPELAGQSAAGHKSAIQGAADGAAGQSPTSPVSTQNKEGRVFLPTVSSKVEMSYIGG